MRLWTHCTVGGCQGSVAAAPVDIPLCSDHLREMREALDVMTIQPSVETYDSVVYYVTWDRGETVKIGTTTSPANRLHALKAGRRHFDFLVAHPGTYAEEKVQHKRFSNLRVKGQREVFQQGPELVEHISNLRYLWPNWREIVRSLAARSPERGRVPGIPW